MVSLANLFSAGIETAGWPAAAVCSSDDDPIARVTNGPALCSPGRDGMILAPMSLEVGLPAGIA